MKRVINLSADWLSTGIPIFWSMELVNSCRTYSSHCLRLLALVHVSVLTKIYNDHVNVSKVASQNTDGVCQLQETQNQGMFLSLLVVAFRVLVSPECPRQMFSPRMLLGIGFHPTSVPLDLPTSSRALVD